MSDAYLILCHDKLEQVAMLAGYFASHGNRVFIHVDASCKEDASVLDVEGVNVVTTPVRVQWADWSMVEATLLLMNAALNSGESFRYVHLISGRCMPVMSASELDNVLTEASKHNVQFIEAYRLPAINKWHADGGMHRVSVWYPRWMVSKYSKWHRYFWPYTNKWRRLRLRRPGYYIFKPFYGGSQWWSLTFDCVRSIVEYSESHRFFVGFFRHAFCSDELFIQCCLARTGFLGLVSNDNKRFIKWGTRNAPSPITLSRESLQEVRASGCFFARKFDLSLAECRIFLDELESV